MTGTAARQAAARPSCPLGHLLAGLPTSGQEHHVVDDPRVLAQCEQLREPHLATIGRGLEDVVLSDEAARWECPALGGDLLVQPPELCPRLQQLVACAPVFARLAGEVDIRVEEYFSPLVHVAWFALERHCFHPFLSSELSPIGRIIAYTHMEHGYS